MKITNQLLFSFLITAVLAGCGGGPDDMPEIGTVSGKVTLGGEPLANANVEYRPTEGRPSVGTTNSDGIYTLQYNIDNEGAKVGEHTITVSRASGDDENYEEGDENDSNDKQKEGLPAKASDGSIKKTVKAGDNPDMDIDL